MSGKLGGGVEKERTIVAGDLLNVDKMVYCTIYSLKARRYCLVTSKISPRRISIHSIKSSRRR